MYCVGFSGGRSRTHGQVECEEWIDSFEAGKIPPVGGSYAPAGRGGRSRSAACAPWGRRDLGTVQGALVRRFGAGSDTLRLWRQSCPIPVLQRPGLPVPGVCKLNYRCQQRTKDLVDPAYDGIQLARKKSRWRRPINMVPADFPYITPGRPKGMHQTTYRRYLARYRRYQEKYRRESLWKLLAILRQ